jgi:hypothetical protein
MSTFSTLQTNVNDALEGDSFTNLTATMIKGWINSAMRWVCNGVLVLPNNKILNHNFSFLETEVEASTVNEQRRYDLPVEDAANDIMQFKAEKTDGICELIDYNDYRKQLTKLDKKEIEARTRFVDIADKGIPSHYCIDQSDLWLYPLPDHSANNDEVFIINFEYYGYLITLSDDDDTNYLTGHYPEILKWKATALGFEWAKDELANYFENKAKSRLLEMILEDEKKKGGVEIGMYPKPGQSLAP